MLRIDSHGGKSSEQAPGRTANRRGQDSFQPDFDSRNVHGVLVAQALLPVRFLSGSGFNRAQPRVAVLQHRHKGLLVERGGGVVEDVVGPLLIMAFVAPFALIETSAGAGQRSMARALDGPSDVLGDRRRKLHKFTARAFEREAMLVFAAGRIRPERRNADAVFAVERL